MDFFTQIFNFFGDSQTIGIIFAIYVGVALLLVLLRIIVCVGYQTHFAFFKMNAKPITERAGLEKIRFGVLRNVISDYIHTAEKNTSGVHLAAIVKKYVLRMSFLGWPYVSMEQFVSGFETMFPIVGFALAVTTSAVPELGAQNSLAFGLTGVVSFALHRLISSVFDFQYSREKLEAEMIEYVEREVGQFYAGDFSTILLRLKNDISSALREQAVSLAHTITNLESNLSVAIGSAVADSFSKIASFGSVVEKPLKDWSVALDMAASQQTKNEQNLERFEEITENLKSTSDVFAAALHRHITSLAAELSAIDKQIAKLSESGVALKDSNNNVKDMISVLQDQSRYIESNQATLRDSLARYEQSLESITQKMGDGFGSIVNYHISGASQAMNTALQANMEAITRSSQEQTTRLEGLFAQLAEQSKNETAAIINMNDQLNVRLDAIESKTI
ncbi:MAG: hypothetical protein LBL96_12105 [Clostridiales bacterium]|jgi:cell division protein FtsB|nr:hypothetical protein [Clostridiales bacterium]